MVKKFTDPIWSDLYRVRLPMLGSRSVEDIRMRGVLLSGNKDVDRDIENRLIVTYITIDKMVEHHRNNVPVRLCNSKDPKLIYEAISRHIHAWTHFLETGVNTGGAPLEDLLAMEHFASTVYEHAKFQLIGSDIETEFLRDYANVIPVNVGNFFKPGARDRLLGLEKDGIKMTEDGTVIVDDGTTAIPDRESFRDFFQERLMRMASKGR